MMDDTSITYYPIW